MTTATLAPPDLAPVTTTQCLTATDRTMLAVDRAVRGLGGPGFETQMLVWLAGRIDVAGLRGRLARFSVRHPVAAARLVEAGSGPRWRYRPGACCPLVETWLEAAEPAAVLDHAARLLSNPPPPEETDPIRFHLLHRPDGRDVLILQYNHALMDNTAAVPLLRRLDRPDHGDADGEDGRRGEGGNVIRDYLRRFDRERRRQALHGCSRLWRQFARGGVVQLGRPGAPEPGPGSLRIAVRRLGQPETSALRERLLQTCGFPNLSMALLGSAFRALARSAPPRPGAANFMAGIGVELGLRRGRGPLFGNPVSVVPIRARPGDLDDRDELVRRLGRQLREHLQAGMDLGLLQLLPWLNRRPADARWLINGGLRQGFSLWYAYFGSLDSVGERFGGAAIEDVCFTGPTWPPMGLTLLVNQFRGRLLFQATYLPESVPEPVVDTFLDQLLADLVDGGGGPWPSR
ncbi:MAG TPA: hypothetical protein VKD90_22690 [Gemmataceae bacterium]|nr:hypothetical protein [Gemmataceae bacterium]